MFRHDVRNTRFVGSMVMNDIFGSTSFCHPVFG